MRNAWRQFKIAVLQWLEERLVAKIGKLNRKLGQLQRKIRAESERVQKRIK